MRILDIHTHKPAPRPEAVVAVSPESFLPLEGQAYSVGIHPWDTVSEISPDLWLRLENACGDSQVLAVGECGIDLLKGDLCSDRCRCFVVRQNLRNRCASLL